jgi:hypothetical protein
MIVYSYEQIYLFYVKMSDFQIIGEKEECGASFISKTGKDKFIGNACFFCCVWSALIRMNPVFLNLKYEDFLEAAGLMKDFSGKMVDTYDHSENLRKLATHYGITIYVYSEIVPDIVHSSILNRFGTFGPRIEIVKLHNRAHFNLIRSFSTKELSEVKRIEAENEMIQIRKDYEFAQQVQEEFNIIESQILKDHELALKLVKIQF